MESQRIDNDSDRGQRRRGRQTFWKIALGVVLLFLLAGGVVCLISRDGRKEQCIQAKGVRERPAPETETEEETEVDENIYCERVYDFEELKGQNEEIYAWITVPGTNVDYPLLQTDTDNYYLNRNLDHSSGYPGCVYSNKCNNKIFTDYITIFYAHNMKNKTMFGSLHNFEDEVFFQENKQFFIDTEYARLTYEIYAAVKFTDAYIPAYYDINSAEGRDEFLEDVAERVPQYSGSYLREDMEIGPEDRLVVLSTCVSGVSSQRYLVIARLAEKIYYDAEAAEAEAEESETDTKDV